MRLVLDTNVVLAGLLWNGLPRRLLDLAIDDVVTLYSSQPLLDELLHTLCYQKFGKRIASRETSAQALMAQYGALVTLVMPAGILPTIERDPDDDAVLACALAAQADLIVSGDAHLLNLKQFQQIPVITAAQAIGSISAP
jgi:putative PIN family toxin of toxin-antitoxin system